MRTAIFICGLFLLFMPDVHWWTPEGFNRFTVFIDGVAMGTVDDPAKAEELYREARKELEISREGMGFMQLPELTTSGEELIRGEIERVNQTFQPAKRIANIIFRDKEFVKTASRKIIRARINE